MIVISHGAQVWHVLIRITDNIDLYATQHAYPEMEWATPASTPQHHQFDAVIHCTNETQIMSKCHTMTLKHFSKLLRILRTEEYCNWNPICMWSLWTCNTIITSSIPCFYITTLINTLRYLCPLNIKNTLIRRRFLRQSINMVLMKLNLTQKQICAIKPKDIVIITIIKTTSVSVTEVGVAGWAWLTHA